MLLRQVDPVWLQRLVANGYFPATLGHGPEDDIATLCAMVCHQRARPRRKRLTMARRMTAPNKEISKAPIEKSPELIVGTPSNGDRRNPASAAPMIPTTIFKKTPC